MNRRSPTLLALLTLLVPLAARAQSAERRFELTPTASYRFGGTLEAADGGLFDADLEVDDGAAFGVTFDIPLSARAQLELLASRQSSELRFDRGLFGGELEIADIDLTYYQVGVLWQWGQGQVNPFLVAALGGANLDPDLPGASSETRFSMSIGGGVKVFFTDSIGMRFEGRGFVADIDGGGDYDRCEDHHRYYDDCYDESFSQGQASIGLILAW